MQALKKFNSGEEDQASGKSEGKFLALAMAEASKVRLYPKPTPFSSIHPLSLSRRNGANTAQLFDGRSSKNGVASGTNKDDVIKQAGEMALKMYVKSQVGGSGGGSGGFAGLASKFLK